MSRPIIVLEGFLGRDPEKRAEGKLVSFSVACQVAKEEVNWYDVAVWDEALKTFAINFLKKGSLVMVSGQQLVVEKEGRKYVNVTAHTIQFVGGGKKKEGGEKTEETTDTAKGIADWETKPNTDDVPF
jgi:single-stranded DNA-binding protein